jgi:hypothetical protein
MLKENKCPASLSFGEGPRVRPKDVEDIMIGYCMNHRSLSEREGVRRVRPDDK